MRKELNKRNFKEALLISPSGEATQVDKLPDSVADYIDVPHYEVDFTNTGYANEGVLYIDPTIDGTIITITKVDDTGNRVEYLLDLSSDVPVISKTELTESRKVTGRFTKKISESVADTKSKLKKFKEALSDLTDEQAANIADDVRFIAEDYFTDNQDAYDKIYKAAEDIEDFNFEEASNLLNDIAETCENATAAEAIWDAIAPLNQD